METGSRRGDVKAAMTFILEEEPVTAAPALARPEPRLLMRSCGWVALICVNCTDGSRSP